jgi:hypothetical protein
MWLTGGGLRDRPRAGCTSGIEAEGDIAPAKLHLESEVVENKWAQMRGRGGVAE